MSALPNPATELIDFPDPRKMPPKRRDKISMPKQPVESVLKQISKGVTTTPKDHPKPENAIEEASDDPEAIEEAEKEEFRKQRREAARIQSESMERMRVARELEVLLNAREKVLDNREALLNAQKSDHLPESDISALERSLTDFRKVMDTANQSLSQMQGILSSRRAKLETTPQAAGDQRGAGEGNPVSGFEDITDVTLADQVAFLQEREAYVEKSENVLFEKAQQLQEWETRLEQMDQERCITAGDRESPGKKEA